MLACHRFGHTVFRLVLFHSTPCSGQDSSKWRWARMAAWLTALKPQTATTRIKISFMGVGCSRGYKVFGERQYQIVEPLLPPEKEAAADSGKKGIQPVRRETEWTIA